MDGSGLLQLGWTAMRRCDWQESLDFFTAADAAGALAPEDLEALSEVGFWAGHRARAVEARARAYAAYVDSGQLAEAAAAALVASRLHFMGGDVSVASGWLGRAQRLLADLPECAAHAQLAWAEGLMMIGLKGYDQALEQARLAQAIAERVGDRDFAVLAIGMQGVVAVRKGDLAGGMRLLDETLAAAVAGELGPFATAEIFCEMIVSCLESTDYQRAAEWLETAERAGRQIVCFPGCCRTHRATVLRHRGQWDEAHRQAHQARKELVDVEVFHEGMALCEMGELYRYRGELGLAEQAFADAYEKGWSPQPGLAQVLFARGDIPGARRMIDAAVEWCVDEPATLAHLLPAQVDIAVAAGDFLAAEMAAGQLDAVSAGLGSPAAAAASDDTAGILALQYGDLADAARRFTSAVRNWQKAGSPYDTARSRMRLASALAGLGDDGSAKLELSTARKTFERLGALPDMREADRRLDDDSPRTASCTFMFTDIVNSTTLLTSIGDDAWHDVWQWHDRTLRGLVGEHQGRVVKGTGDGLFASFDEPTRALDCAVAIQRRLDEHRRAEGFSPAVRVGLHMGSAITFGDDYAGQDVVVAARIGALAGAGEIIVSGDVADHIGPKLKVLGTRTETLKGIPGAVTLVDVDWH